MTFPKGDRKSTNATVFIFSNQRAAIGPTLSKPGSYEGKRCNCGPAWVATESVKAFLKILSNQYLIPNDMLWLCSYLSCSFQNCLKCHIYIHIPSNGQERRYTKLNAMLLILTKARYLGANQWCSALWCMRLTLQSCHIEFKLTTCWAQTFMDGFLLGRYSYKSRLIITDTSLSIC